jgi:hypothetical protein
MQSRFILDVKDQFTFAMTCSRSFIIYEEYILSLPELLTDITKKAIEEEKYVPDGYFDFKRI